jgi:phage baseplate assembly protein W
MCAGIDDVTKEDLGKKDYGSTVATLFGTVIKEAWDYMEMPYQVLEAKETRCYLRGDPFGEITITFAPKSLVQKEE